MWIAIISNFLSSFSVYIRMLIHFEKDTFTHVLTKKVSMQNLTHNKCNNL